MREFESNWRGEENFAKEDGDHIGRTLFDNKSSNRRRREDTEAALWIPRCSYIGRVLCSNYSPWPPLPNNQSRRTHTCATLAYRHRSDTCSKHARHLSIYNRIVHAKPSVQTDIVSNAILYMNWYGASRGWAGVVHCGHQERGAVI